MSSKPHHSGNVFETIVRDIGQEFADTAKQTVRETVKAVSPTEFLKAIYGVSSENPGSPEIPEGANHTPLNIEKTQQKHASAKRDEQELAALRQQYFANVTRETQQARHDVDQQHEQKRILEEEDAGRMRQTQQATTHQDSEAPAGKAHRSILGGKPKKSAGMRVPNNNYETKSNKGR